MDRKDILTTFEAARLCHVSYNTIKNWIKRGLIEAYRTAGGHLRMRLANLEAFCREQGIPMDIEAMATRRKVLVIDNEETVREAMKKILDQYTEKIDFYEAIDGFEAGRMLEQTKPDLVILDIVMPGLDGFKVCQSIKKSPLLKHTKIIVLTGFPTESNFTRAKEFGADACLGKPVDRVALFEAIKTLMEPRRGVRGRRRKRAKR